MPYKIPEWDVFQNYKDRRPPWIRFHRTLLDNRKFQSLPLSARAMLPMLWLLATENKTDYMSGIVDLSDEDICFRLRISMNELEKNVETLVSNCFIEVVRFGTEMYENVSQRQNTETEAKTETDPRKRGFVFPAGFPVEVWFKFVLFRKSGKAPFTQHAADLALKKLAKLKDSGENPEDVINQSIERGWTGLFPVAKENKHTKQNDDDIYRGVKI